MKRYTIHRAAAPLAAEQLLADGPWRAAERAAIDAYPWYEAGARQATRAALLYDEANLYVRFDCDDRHSFARVTALNGPVHEDSCVELFASVAPDERPDYFNLEINCVGAWKLGFGPGRQGRRHVEAASAEQVAVRASLPGPTKDPSPADAGWAVAAALPWAVVSALAGRTVAPAGGDAWRGNFYRCGGCVQPQYACWSAVGTDRPDYHRPEFFGELLFA